MIFRFNKIVDAKRKMSTLADDIAIKKLIEYLRIKTVHPEPDYGNLALIFLVLSLKEVKFFCFERRSFKIS
jgi:hypothetical protein